MQEIYIKIVEIIRSGKYDPDKAHFRTFLSMLIRHQLIALYRKDQARGGGANVSLDAMRDVDDNGRAVAPRPPPELAVPASQPDEIDLAWTRRRMRRGRVRSAGEGSIT